MSSGLSAAAAGPASSESESRARVRDRTGASEERPMLSRPLPVGACLACHTLDQLVELARERVGVFAPAVAVARQHPRETMSAQARKRARLFRPRIPAGVPERRQPLALAAPVEGVAAEQEALLQQVE